MSGLIPIMKLLLIFFPSGCKCHLSELFEDIDGKCLFVLLVRKMN